MQDLRAFMKGNAKKKESIKIAVSDRYKDEKGEDILWELRAITADEDKEIRRSCTKRLTGTKSGAIEEMDTYLYMLKVACKTIVFPNLESQELQDSYGVYSEVDLLKKLLYAGELNSLLELVEEVNGYSKSLKEKLDEVKN